MTQLNDYEFDFDPPSLYETLQAAKDNGIVGEEDTVLTLVLGMIRGHLIVMTGLSRAGKDVSVDAAESVFPSERMVYKWPVDDSETAAYYNRDKINQYPVHRFPDLARLPDHQEKILKAFGEGRDARRNRTDIMAEQRGDDPVEDQVIESPHTTIAFIADDNENVNLNDYPEIRNRALTVSVDASESQTKAVNAKKARERAGLVDELVDPIRKREIREYHSSVPVDEWVEGPGEIYNPGAVAIHEQEPIPQKFPEARQDFERLLEFMETVALYHYTDRLVTDGPSGNPIMLVTPTDVWHAMTILGNRMVMSSLNLTRQDRAILSLLENASSNMEKKEIQQSLRSQGFNITDRDVRRSLESMREKGYVREHQGTPNTYTISEFASVAHHDAGIDYERVVDTASEQVFEIVGNDAAQTYVDTFCSPDGLQTTHPFTGETINILDVDELETMMDDGISDVENTLGSGSGGESEETETETTTSSSTEQSLEDAVSGALG